MGANKRKPYQVWVESMSKQGKRLERSLIRAATNIMAIPALRKQLAKTMIEGLLDERIDALIAYFTQITDERLREVKGVK